MKFLVTGGAGFIGSNLVTSLIDDGHQVYVLDNFSTGVIENVDPRIEGKEGKDILELELDGIFHLAMPSSSPMYKEDMSIVGLTINDFITMLLMAKQNNCKIIYASTSSLYNGCPTPMKEDMPVGVTDFYTETRYAIERMAELFYKLYGIKSVGLRLFSVYGIPERPKGKYANLVSQFLWAMQKDESPVIFGDGEQTRDFTHVSDVVRAFKLAFDSDMEHGVVNVGTGTSYSLNEVIDILNRLLKRDIKPIYVDNPISNYVQDTLADPTGAMENIGFVANVTLEDGITDILKTE